MLPKRVFANTKLIQGSKQKTFRRGTMSFSMEVVSPEKLKSAIEEQVKPDV